MSTSHFERKKWREDMVAFTEKTRGVAELFFYSREQLMAAVAAEAAGDEDAAKITQCFRQWILKAKHVGGALCLGCETRFKPPSPPRPEKFLVIRPFTDPSMVLIMGICEQCSTREDLGDSAVYYLQKVWPQVHRLRGGEG